MSLDLNIYSKKAVRHRGTGVFVRENGQNKELRTVEEVKAYFPDADVSDIHITEYEDDTLLHLNMTHNLTEMASHVPVAGYDFTAYELLWHPEKCCCLEPTTWKHKDSFGDEYELECVKLSAAYVDAAMKAYGYIANHRKELEPYNPSNGWGSYDGLLRNTRELVHCLINIPVEEYGDYLIYSSV